MIFKEGDSSQVEELSASAKKVLRRGGEMRYKPFEERVDLWNDIEESYDNYLDGRCGDFLGDMDNHFRSRFEMALLILAVSFKNCGETFKPAERFSDTEIEAYRMVERYNVFEILENRDFKRRIVSGERESIKLLAEYYLHIGKWLDKTLDDESLKLPVRLYLKRKCDSYKTKINKAVSDLITEIDWFGGFIFECKGAIKEDASPQTVINIIGSVVNRSFDGIGGGIGATKVNIEGSIVQRTEIGSAIHCPACDKELKRDEKFCTNCGARVGTTA